MDERELDGGAIARFDQTEAQALAWAKTLASFRKTLITGGYAPGEAFRLCRLWFGDQLYRQYSETASLSDY